MSDCDITEVRRIRREISAEHGNNLDALVDYYQQMEAKLRAEKRVFFEEPKTNSEKLQQQMQK